MTLRFLGDVRDRPALEAAISVAVANRPALPCVVESWGAFPNLKQARVLWAGVRAPDIEKLVSAVETATATFGEPVERNRFVAHVTLARLAKLMDARSLLDAHKDALLAKGLLDRVVLYDSQATPQGPVYEPLRTWRLGGS